MTNLAKGGRDLSQAHGLGVASALVGASLWGFSGACFQYLMANHGVTSAFATWVRMLAAGVLFAAVLLVGPGRGRFLAMLRDGRSVGSLAVFGVFGLFASQITYVNSVAATNAGTATVIQSTCSVLVMLWMCLRQRRAPRKLEVAGLICALAATWLIATGGDPSALVLPAAGFLWGALNSLTCAFYVVYPKRLFERWGSFAVTGTGMLLGGVAALAVWGAGSLWGQRPVIPVLDGTAVAVLAAIVVLGTFASFALYLHGVAVLGSVRGSMLSAVEPVSASVLSALWLGTVFTGADWLGCALMVAMVVLVARGGQEPAR